MWSRSATQVLLLFGLVGFFLNPATSQVSAQVVLDMPPPPPQPAPMAEQPLAELESSAEVETETATQKVSVGDVALYRYSSTRYAPRGAVQRPFYTQRWMHDFPPYYFRGAVVYAPIQFQTVRPFPLKRFSIRVKR